jgi:hypothetical protein
MSYKPTAHGRPGVGSTKGSAHTKWEGNLDLEKNLFRPSK